MGKRRSTRKSKVADDWGEKVAGLQVILELENFFEDCAREARLKILVAKLYRPTHRHSLMYIDLVREQVITQLESYFKANAVKWECI